MQNNLQEMLDLVLSKSQEINHCLVSFKDMALITEKMEERNQLLVVLIEKALDEGREDIFLRLLEMKKEEEKALQPYQEELNTLKQQVVKINHTQTYLAE